MLDQPLDGDVGIVHIGDAGIDHLAQIVGRNIGRHADGDAGRAVDQQIREARRQDRRLLIAAVIVGLEADGVLVEVVEQRHRRPRQPDLGVAHGRRRIGVHGAEIALPIDQRQAHGEILHHAHKRVIDRHIAMGMVFAHDVADDARGLVVALGGAETALVHAVEDAPVDWLQTVAHVRQRPGNDHAHGVIEVGAFHLLLERHGHNVVAGRTRRFSQEKYR